jgi:hypothetical protein
LVADVFIILYSHGRAKPLGMLGAGDKKSLLTSTTALRAVELCWVHSDGLSSRPEVALEWHAQCAPRSTEAAVLSLRLLCGTTP